MSTSCRTQRLLTINQQMAKDKKAQKFPIRSLSLAEGRELLKNHVIREVSSDFKDQLDKMFILDDNSVLALFIYEEHYWLYPSYQVVVDYVKYCAKREASAKPQTVDEIYGLNKRAYLSLKKHDLRDLELELDLSPGSLDHSLATAQAMSLKIEKLPPDRIDEMVPLMNIYACKVLAQANKAIVIDFQANEKLFIAKVQEGELTYSPVDEMYRQVDEPDEGFSLSFCIDYYLKKHMHY